MAKRITYVNRDTKQESPTLEQWMESLADPTDKAEMLDIYTREIQQESTPGNPPLPEYITMFERYFAENNIEIITTEV